MGGVDGKRPLFSLRRGTSSGRSFHRQPPLSSYMRTSKPGKGGTRYERWRLERFRLAFAGMTTTGTLDLRRTAAVTDPRIIFLIFSVGEFPRDPMKIMSAPMVSA